MQTSAVTDRISTKFATYYIDEFGIFHIEFKIKFNDKVQILDAQSHVNIIVQMTAGEKHPFILDFSNFNYVPSAKVLHFLGRNEELHNLRTCSAIVLRNPIFRPILNQYIRIVKAGYPFKVFKDKIQATAWIRESS